MRSRLYAQDGQRRGIKDLAYHEGRKTDRALRYRLGRRTDEALSAIRRHISGSDTRLLDVGTADGLMITRLRGALNCSLCVGIDASFELLSACGDKRLYLIQADALDLPFHDGAFDVIVATAIIEHVANPGQMLLECHRVLRCGGLAIITSPAPFWEKVATAIGHLKEDEHQETLDLARIKGLLSTTGFDILEARKFMVSPVGFPFEKRLEGVMRRLRFNALLLNQLVVAVKLHRGQ